MKNFLTTLLGLANLVMASSSLAAPTVVATSINSFGLNLHRRLAAQGGNVVTSPWSIETALAMTYGGASDQTKVEMQSVLQLPEDDNAVHAGFASLDQALANLVKRSQENVKAARKNGGVSTALEIHTANRLFGDEHYPFEKPFLSLTQKYYGAPFEILNFRKAPEASRLKINQWVAAQTKDRIRDLIPAGVILPDTRLVLTNAIYLKAAWAEEFQEEARVPFFVNGTQSVKVPGLMLEETFGYQKILGGVAVTIAYAGGGLQFVLLIPDSKLGLAAMEKSLTPELLAKLAQAKQQRLLLHFPKFKLQPDSIQLAQNLIAMGMPTAFDQPKGSAHFSKMAVRKPDDYLAISKVIHQAFIAVDQYGTEAAAATAAVMGPESAMPSPRLKPLEIRVDRPFAFAIQHTESGACLFLGRVTDPQ